MVKCCGTLRCNLKVYQMPEGISTANDATAKVLYKHIGNDNTRDTSTAAGLSHTCALLLEHSEMSCCLERAFPVKNLTPSEQTWTQHSISSRHKSSIKGIQGCWNKELFHRHST